MPDTKTINHEVEHGIYMFDGQVWRSTSWEDIFKKVNGAKVIVYYGNTLCGACMAFNIVWNSVASVIKEKFADIKLATVMCGWFEERCQSNEARELFAKNRVWGTPTIVVYCARDGVVKELDRAEGTMTTDQLVEFIMKNRKKNC